MAKTISLESLVSLVGGHLLRGDLAAEYSGLASLEKAGAREISFLGNLERYALDFQKSGAGVILVEPGTERDTCAVALVEVAKPSDAFSKVIAFFARESRKFEAGIHPSAWVSSLAKLDSGKVSVRAGAVVMDGVEVGDGTEIGANVVISEGVRIGKDCLIYPNVTVREYCVLGDRVILQPGAVIGADGYGYQFVGGRHEKIAQVGNVELGDDVEVGANTTIDRARFGTTRIGEGTKIDNLVQIGHNAEIGKHCLIIAQTGMAGSSKFEDYVTCAAQCGVVGHITVGKGAILGSRSGVTTNLEGGKTYLGNPAIPFVQEQKYRALVRKLPKLLDDVKELRKRGES